MSRPHPASRLAGLLGLLLLLGAVGAPGAAGDPEVQRRLTREDPRQVAVRLALSAPAYDALLWVRLAEVERFRCDLAAAHARIDRAAALDPLAAAVHAARSEVLLLEARADEALLAADRGLATAENRLDGDLWRARCLALVELRRYDEALEAGRRASTLEPSDARSAEALGRAAYHAGDMDLSRAAYRTAVELDAHAEEANLRLGNGFGPALEGRPWAQPPQREAFDSALAAWEAGDQEAALRGFDALAQEAPEVFKYRLGVGGALAARRRAHEARAAGAPAATDLYALLPAPEVPDLEAVLPDAAMLSPARRHALLVACAPLRPWWPALAAAGARHDLLCVAENLGDRAARAELRTRLTFDGRHYEHLRGVGGQHGATGAEKLDEAAELCFHTLAHELAHQVLSYAFPREELARVKVLYARAVAEDRCLDFYSASNVDEYFAQGYEAFISQVKRGCLKETQRHTRIELRTRDPELYAFLVEHLDLAHETPAAMAPFLAALQQTHLAPPPAPPSAR